MLLKNFRDTVQNGASQSPVLVALVEDHLAPVDAMQNPTTFLDRRLLFRRARTVEKGVD